MKKRKQLAALCMAGLMAAGSLSGTINVSAQTKPETAAEAQDGTGTTAETMKKILQMVKEKITIPASYSDFNYEMIQQDKTGSQNWIFYWDDNENEKEITVGADSKGNILNYNVKEEKSSVKPNYLRSEVEGKAEAFLKKTAPMIASSVRLLPDQNASIYRGIYYFYYVRVQDGIDLPENTACVGVNYETGKVVYYDAQWNFDLKFPEAKAKLTAAEAAAKIGSNEKMLLTYKTAYEDDGSRRAYLAYSPEQSYISVDAVSGKVYLSRDRWESQDEDGRNESTADKDMGTGGLTGLTKEELKKIEELGRYLSKEEAVELLMKQDSLYLTKDMTDIEANLVRYNGLEKGVTYVWEVRLGSPERDLTEADMEENSFEAFAAASLDAETGRILSFRASVPSYYDGEKWKNAKVTYTKEQCRQIFEKYAKGVNASRFQSSQFSGEEADYNYVLSYKNDQTVYGGYNYMYERLQDGILYPDNGFYGAVDGVTGKIYSYSAYWDDSVKFESSKGIMTEKQAFDAYIKTEGFGLYYELNQVYTEKNQSFKVRPEVRLVYRADVDPAVISPFTGKQLDYDGKPYQKPSTAAYTDISQSKYKKDIQLLADLGYRLEGEKFNPEQAITAKEAETLLQPLNSGYYRSQTKELSGTVTQISFVKRMISIMNLNRVASIEGIYVTDYANDSELSSNDKGYIAIAQGLGILAKGNNKENFDANAKVTRELAAHYIMQAISAGEME